MDVHTHGDRYQIVLCRLCSKKMKRYSMRVHPGDESCCQECNDSVNEEQKPASQEELRRHLLSLGMSEETIGDEEIPQGVLLISTRPLTEAEEEYAKTLEPTL